MVNEEQEKDLKEKMGEKLSQGLENMKNVNVIRERKKDWKTPTKETNISKEKKVVKAEEAVVKANDIPVSTKHCVAICAFIKNKTPDEAISLLGRVLKKKTAIPMKGEIPHRKGMMSGRYPAKSAEYFIKMIRNVVANANVKGMNIENLRLHGMANKGVTFPHSGRKRGVGKRTNIVITAREAKK